MGEEWSARLAVARLDELTPAHRFREGQPMHGFCLINSDGARCRVSLYIENGRALTDRSGFDGFYYEGWLVGPGGPASLGAFNLGPGGQGSATRVLDGGMLRSSRCDVVRVTAEPFGGSQTGSIAVLEGRLIWLETEEAVPLGASPEVAAPVAAWHSLYQEAEVREPVLQGAGVGGGLELAPEPAVADESADLSSAVEVPEAEPAVAEVPVAEVPVAEEPVAEEPVAEVPVAEVPVAEVPVAEEPVAEVPVAEEPVADEPVADEPVAEEPVAETPVAEVPVAEVPVPEPTVTRRPVPEPPVPEPRHANPLEAGVQLVQRHPLAPRAAGTATIRLRQGALSLMLRGLPSPTALGRDQSTDRPFNAYRVWLVNQQTHVRTPIGYCERAWGENFRFQAEGLPLHRHDTILVTVEDRTGSNFNSASPQVLMGSYSA